MWTLFIIDGLFLGLLFGLVQLTVNNGILGLTSHLDKQNKKFKPSKKRGFCRMQMIRSADAAKMGVKASVYLLAGSKEQKSALWKWFVKGLYCDHRDSPVPPPFKQTPLGISALCFTAWAFQIGIIWFCVAVVLQSFFSGDLVQKMFENSAALEDLGQVYLNSFSRCYPLFAMITVAGTVVNLIVCPVVCAQGRHFNRRVEFIETGIDAVRALGMRWSVHTGAKPANTKVMKNAKLTNFLASKLQEKGQDVKELKVLRQDLDKLGRIRGLAYGNGIQIGDQWLRAERPDTMTLYKALEEGIIRLLNADWIRAQGKEFRIQRYQDLEALEKQGEQPWVPKDQAVKLLKDGHVACMTYRWLRFGLPDPNGYTSGALAAFLADDESKTAKFNAAVDLANNKVMKGRENTFGNIKALFWDYGSFPQHLIDEVEDVETGLPNLDYIQKKNEEENNQTKTALSLMAHLYASPRVTLLRIGHYPTKQVEAPLRPYLWLSGSGFKFCVDTTKPEGTEDPERLSDGTLAFRYDRSGWCFFESNVGSLAQLGNEGQKVYDLITEDYFTTQQACPEGKLLSWNGTEADKLPEIAAGGVKLTPEEFGKIYKLQGDQSWTHPSGRKFVSLEFTNGKDDKPLTLDLYTKFYDNVKDFDSALDTSFLTRLPKYVLESKPRVVAFLAVFAIVLIVTAVVFLGLVSYTAAPGFLAVPQFFIALSMLGFEVMLVYNMATNYAGGLRELMVKLSKLGLLTRSSRIHVAPSAAE